MSNLEEIRDKIEGMSTYNQIEILKIFTRHKNITLNENKNGTLVNLTDVDEDVIKELLAFILYVETQEKNLNETELIKEEFKNIYFAKDNKDNTSKCI